MRSTQVFNSLHIFSLNQNYKALWTRISNRLISWYKGLVEAFTLSVPGSNSLPRGIHVSMEKLDVEVLLKIESQAAQNVDRWQLLTLTMVAFLAAQSFCCLDTPGVCLQSMLDAVLRSIQSGLKCPAGLQCAPMFG